MCGHLSFTAPWVSAQPYVKQDARICWSCCSSKRLSNEFEEYDKLSPHQFYNAFMSSSERSLKWLLSRRTQIRPQESAYRLPRSCHRGVVVSQIITVLPEGPCKFASIILDSHHPALSNQTPSSPLQKCSRCTIASGILTALHAFTN